MYRTCGKYFISTLELLLGFNLLSLGYKKILIIEFIFTSGGTDAVIHKCFDFTKF